MLSDAQILAELRQLGLDEQSHKVVSLLPLVMVAWADHEVQPEERKTILDVARGHGFMDGPGGAVLERWLTERPSNETFRRGTLLFVHLVHREEGLGADLPPGAIDYTVDLCEMVAEAAGGVFGFGKKVSADESKAIRAIAAAMAEEAERLAPSRAKPQGGKAITQSWMAMVDALEEGLPDEL